MRIFIEEKVANTTELSDVLTRISFLLEDGYTSGHNPNWYTETDEDDNDGYDGSTQQALNDLERSEMQSLKKQGLL